MILLAALAVAALGAIFPDQSRPDWNLDGSPLVMAAGNLYRTGGPDLVTVEKTAAADYRIYVRAGLRGPWAGVAAAAPAGPGGRVDPPPGLLDLGGIDYPGALAIADVDRDGWPDILAGSLYDRHLFLFRQVPPFQFAPPETLPAPALLQSIAVGTMTPAGRRDIAAVGADSLVLLPQLADDHYGRPIGLSNRSGAIALGDLDNDGRLEVLTAEYANQRVRIWRVDAEGTLRGVGVLAAPEITVSMMLVDLDGDGYGELVRQLTGSLVVHRNLFGILEEAGEPFGERGSWLGAADLDADGRNDLVIGMPGGVVVHRSMPGGSPGPGRRYGRLDLGGEAGVPADWNGDGRTDVALTDAASRRVVLLTGDGEGGLEAPTLLTMITPSRALLAGDWDGNGLPEVAVRLAQPGRIEILASDDSPLRPVADISGAHSVMISADVTGDGREDLVLGSDDGAIRLVRADEGYPLHEVATWLMSPVPARGLSTGDFNSDGTVDVAVTANPDIVVLMRDASDKPAAAQWLDGPDISEATQPVDFDGDGDLDLLARQDLAARACVYLNDGGGRFGPAELLWPGGFVERLARSDLDADSHMDIVTASGRELVIHWGRADGPPVAETRQVLPAPIEELVIADFNGDGIPELVVSDGTTPVLRLLTFDSTRQPGPEVTFTGSGGRLAMLPFDWSLDGWPDLVMARTDGTMPALQLIRNIGQTPRDPVQQAAAIRQPGRCLVSWTTLPFGRHRRWWINRGPAIDGPLAELNREPLTDSPGYAFADSLVPDEATRYWLREEQTGLPAIMHGPYAIPALPPTLLRFQAMARLDSIDVSWQVNEFGVPLSWRVMHGPDMSSLSPVPAVSWTGRTEYRVRVPVPAGAGVWALEQRSRSGGVTLLGPFDTSPTPARPLALGPASPNPSRGAVTMALYSESPGIVQMRLFDLRGRLLAGPINLQALGGAQMIGWDGEVAGRPAAAGVYWLEVRQGNRRAVIRLVRGS